MPPRRTGRGRRGLPVHAVAGASAPRPGERRLGRSRESGVIEGWVGRKVAPPRSRREGKARCNGDRHGERPEGPRSSSRPRGPRKRRSRDTDLPVLQLLQMHAGHGGRRQHHRQAQHHLRAPRHPRADRRGLRLPARGPRAAAERDTEAAGQARPLERRAPAAGAPPAAPGASNREPSAEPRPCCAEAWLRVLFLPSRTPHTHIISVPSERDAGPDPLLNTSLTNRIFSGTLRGRCHQRLSFCL